MGGGGIPALSYIEHLGRKMLYPNKLPQGISLSKDIQTGGHTKFTSRVSHGEPAVAQTRSVSYLRNNR